jgi:hypothetical protein
VLESRRLEAVRAAIRFLQPGASIDLERDSAASLALRGELALAHWSACWREQPPPAPRPQAASLAELKSAFARYRERAGAALHGLPRALEGVGLVRPLVLHLADLRQTLELSYGQGARLVAREAPADVAMCSGTALYLLKAEDGFDTTYAGGCFWVMRPGGLSRFGRFFLPQRMARRGLDRRRPLAMGALLLRAVLARMLRQVGAALR